MAKWVIPAAEIAVGTALEFVPGGQTIGTALIMAGATAEVGNLISLLSAKTGDQLSNMPTAEPRKIVYGTLRVDGVMIYESTSGHQLNRVLIWACHPCQSIDAIYLDGRQAHLTVDDSAGGHGDGGSYTDDSGNHYSFGTELAIFSTLGSAAGYWFHELNGNDAKWTSDCTLNNLCASYVKTTYNTNVYSGPPNVRATIHGKNDIWDPRLGNQFLMDGVTPNPASHAWTDNWALIVADFLTNDEFGVGESWSRIDVTNLIAAANICDELVSLANGLTEKRYTINYTFDTTQTPGAVLETMMKAAEGKISYSGGQWKLYPAAWYGATLAFTDDDFAPGEIEWKSERKRRELCNVVRGTYVCPQYPYAVIGYNRDNKDSSIFAGEWRPTDMPEYAQDSYHGYSSDANLAEDGEVLYTDQRYEAVTSCATAQRLAKIYLLRNRQQGSGRLPMKLSAYQTRAVDVIEMNFAALNWTNKYLEVEGMRFVIKADTQDQGSSDVMTLQCELDVIETDPSVYTWSTSEERTVQNTTSPAIGRDWQVDDPTSLTLSSSSSTAVLGQDGVAIPRILATWTEPADPYVTSGGNIEAQFQKVGDADWTPIAKFEGTRQYCYINGVVCGQQYNVRIRSVRSNGASGNWVQAGPHTVSVTWSSFSTSTVLNGQGSVVPTQPILISYTDTPTSISLSWSAQTLLRADGSTLSVASGSQSYTGLSATTAYYLYPYVDLATATIKFANPNPPQTSPSDTYATQAGLDGRYPGKPMVITTPSSGSGGGTGGGSGSCPEAAELVTVQGKGNIAAGEVMPGDLILGHCFASNSDVYRRVIGKKTVPCAAWRMVDGHRVSPCEPVWDGAWKPAFQVPGASIDMAQGIRVDLAVESDNYDESNFYLVSGARLLIHNYQMQPS